MNGRLERDLETGRILLGGCVVTDNDPSWQCVDCGGRICRESEMRTFLRVIPMLQNSTVLGEPFGYSWPITSRGGDCYSLGKEWQHGEDMMSIADSTKVKAYFHEIDDHVVRVVRDTSVSDSCFATLFLIFAAVDGLGKLTHPDARALPGTRFKFFISKLGDKYERQKDTLWGLRKNLFHNALNVNAFLSMTALGREHHLEEVDAPSKIYINTSVLFEDFCRILESEKQRIENDISSLSQASERLEWCYDVDPYLFADPSEPLPTMPPPIEFVVTRV
ncbi:MAG: hypothetical protein SWE60_01870 [Thermodesulfobacteriota bacterium]|nr:hypothetical protein [Thermodesulfobacteriota bacterium]